MINILVVEDDPLIGHAVEQWLKKDNLVIWVQTIAEARTHITDMALDIILLDLGLPDGSGLDFLKSIKRQKQSAGVLIFTAYSEVTTRIQGLDLGADDYLVKPIDFNELDARIRAVKRRKDGLLSTVIEHGRLKLDINGLTATIDENPLHLSHKEVSILSILLQGRDRYYSRAMLEDRLYPQNSGMDSNSIEVHISTLRKKLGKSIIKTTRGLGYIIESSSAND